MNKITVIPILAGDQKFDWNKQEYEPGKERLAYGKPVEITDEEIDNQLYAQLRNPIASKWDQGFIACWHYIKQRINSQ